MKKHSFFLFVIFSVIFIFKAASFASEAGYLGVYVRELSRPVKIALNLDYGLIVTEVAKNSPAEKGGVKEGDVILNINNEKMRDYNDLRDIITDNPDKEINIELLTSGRKKNQKIMLTRQKDSFYKWKWEGESFSRKDGDKFPFGFFSNEDVEKMKGSLEELRENLENLYKELGKEYKKKENSEKRMKDQSRDENSGFNVAPGQFFHSDEI